MRSSNHPPAIHAIFGSRTRKQKVTAPVTGRALLKLAASMLAQPNAMRHRTEFAANASGANTAASAARPPPHPRSSLWCP